MEKHEHIARAVKLAGGISRLAKALGVEPPTVHQWLRKQRPVPAARCPQIETVTSGEVTKEQLRPDIFGQPTTNEAA